MPKNVHTHTSKNGSEPTRSHTHSHTHTHQEQKAVLNRLSRIIGHTQSVKKMIEDGRDCSEVLIQLSAVSAAIRSVSRLILKDHISTCLVDAVKENNYEAIEELNKAIDKFMK